MGARRAMSADEREFWRAVGRRIELRRLEVGLSQQAVASMIGVTRQEVYRFEVGEARFSLYQLRKVSSALRVSLVEMMPVSNK